GFTEHGFLLSRGSSTTLDPPGSFFGTYAAGINDLGQIVGSYADAADVPHGFLLSGGSYTTPDVPRGAPTHAPGVNDTGQIVGSSDRHAFLTTPIPELAWHGPSIITTSVSGNPSLLQAIPGTYGTKGNYELVVPLQSGGIAHFERNNDDP